MFRGRKVPRYLLGEKVKGGSVDKSLWALDKAHGGRGLREQ
jgi:hypothetical protein